MGLGDVTADSVLQAIAEHDRLGPVDFLTRYGFDPARRFWLTRNGQAYNPEAIIGVAHGYATGTFWRASDLPRSQTSIIRALQQLGFDARDNRKVKRPRTRAIYGAVPGYPSGSTFASRAEAQKARVHRPGQAGICGTKDFGAESIVVSGGYEDDIDLGDVIIYTGHGGQDKRGRQVSDQTFDDPGNAALLTSSLTGEPVRVIRGAHRGSSHAPESGFRYDGLFQVVDAWQQKGRGGHQVCLYRLVQLADEPVQRNGVGPGGTIAPGRRTASVQRIVRSISVSQYVKQVHDDTCQACGTRLAVAGRGYSEGAHIRPLGRGHDGPDVPSNVLCLCPNCHVLFDNGALIVDSDWHVWVNGKPRQPLITDERHAVGEDYLEYHRKHYGGR